MFMSLAAVLAGCAAPPPPSVAGEGARLGGEAAWPDRDGDGYGDPLGAPAPGVSSVDNAADCDDGDPDAYPGASESWFNGLTDNDCDGRVERITARYEGPYFLGTSPRDQAGRRLARLGDLDGDGRDELGVASPYADTLEDGGGTVYAVSGEAGGGLWRHRRLDGSEAGMVLGASLDGGEDLTGDGVPDALIGATGYRDGQGGCFLVSGAAWAGTFSLRLPVDATGRLLGPSPDTYGGTACVFAGDADGDGRADVAMSAPSGPGGAGSLGSRPGQVALFSSAALLEAGVLDWSEAIWVAEGQGRDDRMGAELARVEDLDGDGVADLLVGGGVAGGAFARVLSGADGRVLQRLGWADWMSHDTAPRPRPVGDVDGDGRRDVVVLTDQALFYALDGDPIGALGTGDRSWLTDAVDLGDLDGDGRDETLLTAANYRAAGGPWAGLLFAADLGEVVAANALSLQAVARDPDASFGYRAVFAGDPSGDGDAIALGGWSESSNGTYAGAVALLPVPR